MEMKKIEIEYIHISEIIPYKENPRNNDNAVKIVKKSIKEFGFKNPIILDKNKEIIAGHTRFKAAKELEIKQIPIIWVGDLTKEQVKAFRIMDNKSQDFSEWNKKLLLKNFEVLKEKGFDLDLTGFDEEERNSEFKLNEVENLNIFDERHKVIMLIPPEAVKLKEREMFIFKEFEDYKKVKMFFKKGEKLDILKLLELIK